MGDRLIILGARGSVPVFGEEYRRYGGSTTCFLAELGGEYIVLDAGTGLLHLPEEALARPELTLLLTHPHADHLLGLPLCAYVMRSGACLSVYGRRRGGADVGMQLAALMSPPLWPVSPEQLPARIACRDLPQELLLGPVTVRTMEGVHPGGVSLIRLDCGGKSVVLITDCTLTDAFYPRAAMFAADCDLLLCDGQYDETEWAAHASFGHNTWLRAAEFGRACGARQMRIVHHAPERTDAALDAAAAQVAAIHPRCTFAREGEEVAL